MQLINHACNEHTSLKSIGYAFKIATHALRLVVKLSSVVVIVMAEVVVLLGSDTACGWMAIKRLCLSTDRTLDARTTVLQLYRAITAIHSCTTAAHFSTPGLVPITLFILTVAYFHARFQLGF